MRRILVFALLAAFGAAVAIASWPARPAADWDPAPERRWTAVLAAAELTVPMGTASGSDSPYEFQGDRSRSTAHVVNVAIIRRRFDWTRVPMDDARGGPVEALLAQGKVHEEALREAGFQTMLSETFAAGGEPLWSPPVDVAGSPERAPPPRLPPDRSGAGTPHRPTISVESFHQSDSGSGGGVGQVSLDRPKIVQERIYVVPRSGATLFVRSEYVQAERSLEVEFRYADRTILGVAYPIGSYVQGREPGGYAAVERIVPAKRPR